jgi:hypothetical protein
MSPHAPFPPQDPTELERKIGELLRRAADNMQRGLFGEITLADVRPPEFAEYLLWYLPRDMRYDAIGDLAGEFTIIYYRFGKRKAVIWYYFQVGASFWPVVVAAVQKLARWGVFAWIGEAFRRLNS